MKANVENILEIILEADVLADVASLNNNTILTEQGIDSLDIVNIYLLIEEKFDIKIPDEDLTEVKTVDSIVAYINKQKS